ncbi:hypothetical protein VNO78_21299 [Psophocarpus tetragonolobus]|uniref:Uncharacterized protein n=1 Tax=Psophocarpus tetragonolobus TaxID=3891 RepID=A0AAN9SCI7_PSOTE
MIGQVRLQKPTELQWETSYDYCVDVQVGNVKANMMSIEIFGNSYYGENLEVKAKTCPNKCSTCRKRVGLTGF